MTDRRAEATGGPVAAEAVTMAGFAAVFADSTRAAVALSLFDGRAWTCTELARAAGVSAPTMSAHLTRMIESGVLVEERQGRHRYVRLAGADVAEFVESMSTSASALDGVARTRPLSSLREVRTQQQFATARTCYDHLAGRLGVAVYDALVTRGALEVDAGFTLTANGRAWFDEIGCSLDRPTGSRRPLVRTCLDRTERRHHLAGVAGAALTKWFVDRAWLVGVRDERTLRVTPHGVDGFAQMFGIDDTRLITRTRAPVVAAR